MRSPVARLFPPWVLIVFTVALAARLAFWCLVDQPLLYSHQYHYFTNGLRIAEHPHPWSYLLYSDEWRLWDRHWTIAPLYYPFEAAVFRIFGPHLEPLRLVQCLLGALTSVAVAVFGRQTAGPRGWWAGLAYALNGYSIELPTWTVTENLHNLLLAVAMVVVLESAARRSLRWTAAGGALLGLSALARSVSSAFLPVAAAWRWWFAEPGQRWRAGAVLLFSGAAVILPWSARNVLIMGDWVPIETTAYENIWYANHFTDAARFLRQEEVVHGQPTPAAKRAAAMHFALRGLRRHPGEFLHKVNANFWHFFRAEGLHYLLTLEQTQEPWRPAFYILLEDTPILLLLPPFLAYALAGRRRPAWALVTLWSGYYLFFEIVVFLNEVPRHRSGFLPFFLAGGVAGLLLLADRTERRRPAVWIGIGIGLVVVAVLLRPYPIAAWRALASTRAMQAATGAVTRGDFADAERLAAAAAARAPSSPRPWLLYSRALSFAGRPREALDAYDRAIPLGRVSWTPVLVRPRLLLEAGRKDEVVQALRDADWLSWNQDPWLALEAAWRELPPPRTNEIALGVNDYGAVRGFFHPRGLEPWLSRHRLEWNQYDASGPQPPAGAHRWTRHRAWLRLTPTEPADQYTITLSLGSPFPSPRASADVRVRVNGGDPVSLHVTEAIRPYAVSAPRPPAGQPLVIQIDAPTWCRPGEPANQGVRIDRLTVEPLGAR